MAAAKGPLLSDTTLTYEDLLSLVRQILVRGGLSPLQAGALARAIAAGERDACKSHGIYRIEGCLRTLQAGKVVGDAVPELASDDSGIVRVNAGGGFANAAFDLGCPALADRARTLGLAALVINDCTHFSALWPEIEALTDLGLVAMAMCPSYASVAPTGGTAPLLGTNPFAFGWPRRTAIPMSSTSPPAWPRGARSSCTAAPTRPCPKAGPSTHRASPPQTPRPPSTVQCCPSGTTRDRPSRP